RSSRSTRLELECLEDRQLLSTSGVISSITDPGGHPTVFAIGTDSRLYATGNGSGWVNISNDSQPRFREVSAGIDASGRACCYAIAIGSGNVWEFNTITSFGVSGWAGSRLDGAFNLHVSATTHGECYDIDGGHNVWVFNGAWRELVTGSGAVQ